LVEILYDGSTIDFTKQGDRYISEYLFSNYYDGEGVDDFVNNIRRIDPLSKNYAEFVEELNDKFEAIKETKIQDLFPSPLVERRLKKMPTLRIDNDEYDIVLIEKIENTVKDLTDANTRARLSLLGAFTEQMERVTGQSTLKPMEDEAEEILDEDEYLETLDENSIERSIFQSVMDNFEIEEVSDGFEIRLYLIEEKERILIEYGVSTLGKGEVKTSSGKDLVLFDENNRDVGGTNIHEFTGIESVETASGAETFELYTDIDKNRLAAFQYLFNNYRDEIGDIVNGIDITIKFFTKHSRKQDAMEQKKEGGSGFDIEYKIKRQPFRLTEYAVPTGQYERGKAGFKPARKKYVSKNYEAPHLNIPMTESKRTLGSIQATRNSLRQVGQFFGSIANKHNRLERAINALEGRVI
tara:strand:- start:2159 stop:3391 length:1233 start_codon:yes stop_codon:yes gene_type:complete